MTAVNPFFSSYMLNYQKTYPDCLGADRFIATVSKTTTETRKDGFGFEISRNAWTEYDKYTMPRRLAPHFEKLWRSSFSGDAVASDALFNDQKSVSWCEV
ncbi:hypothetical protein Q7C_1558 [Methylophaga frappieri]|jgi:hypothetical protein|uniref:Uncharacterized protein n=1 Tax=Methylophaga frappieri (strain ATCC BAA-2434 / DSM 25690 / JAM7) TaxID=754477 RepID=I1YIG4_METFJ|nr:hypothetical protein [Methylophaga frappieri]AFJ02707.1 hypothetical protein Q7C_1558 [Methylophaga frappieri]